MNDILREEVGGNTKEFSDGDNLVRHLGLDMVDRWELCMALEEEFGIEITDEDWTPVIAAAWTVGDLITFVRGRVKAARQAMSAGTEVRHTPGPWGLYGSEEPTQGSLEAAPGLSIGSVHHTEPIARVSGYLHDVRANASLIAAAPDLLESAKECEALLVSMWGETSGGKSGAIRDKLRAAIAKATGRTP